VTPPIHAERSGHVLVVTLAAPERRNALSKALLGALRAALCDDAGDLGAVVLTGGPDVFSAGADLRELTGTRADVAMDDELGRTVAALRDLPVPVIAAIDGPCVGAAVELALACDVRIAGAGAFFEVPAVRLGLLYSPAALVRMRRAAPAQTLARLLLLGERLAAADALAAGLVARCVPARTATEAAAALAERVPTGGADAMRATKALLGAADPDPAAWERVRLELLESPARGRAVAAAKERLRTPAAP
jgi:enoyl-CoA hydratase/carnithine racemase